ncbi:maleylpyruvate isomerase family mycothiol-dependent enzyme [Nocardioides sp.]|uniref:maleylpyruvate isomerase family mycothiol-dependent enzyme n=1 Tax=Nocardioides sp. TaxID=35761 RepID=UPI00261C19F7|nr:maleylpyruvate isomerase family mycothiol-dependent enzyme [Nocardioides sp.]MDI6908228.1 maleylpyruvate isomerase family mycothiol-dependent enzyme [Nocardioides sp.]
MADARTSPEPATFAEVLLPEATRSLIRTTDGLEESEYAAASSLPGWTRAHVLAHLALNAEGLAGALAGIVKGRRVPMYASPEARDADIEELAGKAPAAIRTRLLGACTDLADAITAVPDDAWDTRIERTPGGPSFPASAVPGMRLREVEIHHVDLAAGYDRSGWSPELTIHVLDTAETRGRGGAAFAVHATDLGRSWAFGDPAGGGPTASGAAADLAWWLTGRGSGEGLACDGGELPRIEEW